MHQPRFRLGGDTSAAEATNSQITSALSDTSAAEVSLRYRLCNLKSDTGSATAAGSDASAAEVSLRVPGRPVEEENVPFDDSVSDIWPENTSENGVADTADLSVV